MKAQYNKIKIQWTKTGLILFAVLGLALFGCKKSDSGGDGGGDPAPASDGSSSDPTTGEQPGESDGGSGGGSDAGGGDGGGDTGSGDSSGGANQAPTADAASETAYAHNPLALTLTGSDPDSDPLIYTVVSGPSNGSLDTASLPNVVYTADAGYAGADSFIFNVSDGSLTSDDVTVSLSVNDWCLPDWEKRVSLSPDNSDIAIDAVSTGLASEELSGFQALVALSEPMISFADFKANGDDVRFCDPATGAELTYEIARWDATNLVASVWVKTGTIAADSTTSTFHMYYKNAAAATASDSNTVWNDHAVVWHLEEDPEGAAPQFQDATVNANHGTGVGTMTLAANQMDGRIGKGLYLNGSTQHVLKDDAVAFPETQITASVWIKTDTTGEGMISYATGSSGGADNMFLLYGQENIAIYRANNNDNSGVSASNDEWRLLSATWDQTQDGSGNNFYVYLDGVEINSGALTDATPITPLGALALGGEQDSKAGGFTPGQSFEGLVDEMRIAPVIRSAAWMAASYLNETDAFLTAGAIEDRP